MRNEGAKCKCPRKAGTIVWCGVSESNRVISLWHKTNIGLGFTNKRTSQMNTTVKFQNGN